LIDDVPMCRKFKRFVTKSAILEAYNPFHNDSKNHINRLVCT